MAHGPRGDQEPVTHLRLALAPPLLGEVLLDIRQDNGTVTAHAIVSQPATEQVLRQVEAQVQQLLESQGLRAGGFDVTCGHEGPPRDGGQGGDMPAPPRDPSGALPDLPITGSLGSQETMAEPLPPRWSSGVDIYA
jgi:hypothetical protein